MKQPTRSLSKKLRDQQDGKVTRWAIFIPYCIVPEMKSGGVFIPDYTQCRPLRGGHTIYMVRKCAEINILRFALRPALNPVYAGKHRGSF